MASATIARSKSARAVTATLKKEESCSFGQLRYRTWNPPANQLSVIGSKFYRSKSRAANSQERVLRIFEIQERSVKSKKQLKSLGNRSISTWPHASTLREFMADCEARGQTVSVRLRQILDAYYSNERLKAIGRDSVETPIRRVQKEAMSEELVPLKNRMTEIEKGVQATRSIAEDVLGRLAQMTLDVSSVSPEINGEVLKKLDGLEGLMARLVLRALGSTVRAAVQAELKTGHVIRVRVNPETGVEIYAEFEVVDEVTNPETELTLDEAQELFGERAQLGSKFLRRIHNGVDSVRVIAQAANQFLQRG